MMTNVIDLRVLSFDVKIDKITNNIGYKYT